MTYAYFPNKEALFLAAVDEDAAAVIEEGLVSVVDESQELGGGRGDWRTSLMTALVAAVDKHPLARRLLAGLEPEVTVRVIEMPALAELRKAIAERLRSEQASGTVRTDIDPVSIANGLVAIVLSLLMSIVQLGPDAVDTYAGDVINVFAAAIDAMPAPATGR